MGGNANTGGAAEEHCQKYGKHAVPIAVAENDMIFKCVDPNEKQPVRR
jgi:hypothetical protein